MKTRNIFIWIMLLIMGLTACSEEEVNTYSADEGIYFNQRIRVGNILTDSTNFTFVYIEESQNEATVSIPVQLVGRATDEPRGKCKGRGRFRVTRQPGITRGSQFVQL